MVSDAEVGGRGTTVADIAVMPIVMLEPGHDDHRRTNWGSRNIRRLIAILKQA